MSRKSKEWKSIAHLYADLAAKYEDEATRSREALARMWIGIEMFVAPNDPGLANSLRMQIIGDLLPGLILNYDMDEEDGDHLQLPDDEEEKE